MNSLLIDLTRENYDWENSGLEGIGGIGTALRIFDKRVHWEKDSCHYSQPVVFAAGPLSGLFPTATKVAAVFRSPHTGNLGESYAGGRAGLVMGNMGLTVITIVGKAVRPMIMEISDEKVKFRDAATFWGRSAGEFHLDAGKGIVSTWVIGPAGEKLVSFGNVTVDGYRHFGRMGLGAVLGSKNVKAIVLKTRATRNRKVSREFSLIYDRIYRKIVDERGPMEKYRNLGTTANVLSLNKIGGLPARNLQNNHDEFASRISGEAFAAGPLVRKLSCGGCPLGCIHLGLFRGGALLSHNFFGELVPYDHEPVYALGTMLGMGSTRSILALIKKVEEAGLDVITTGVSLAWATEALEKGLISKDELQTTLKFGETGGYLDAIPRIVYQPTEFYARLAKGLAHTASFYGGEEFALSLGGMEAAGYHTGYGAVLGQLLGGRHSHLDNAGYSFDQEMTPGQLGEISEKLVEEEQLRSVLNSLVVCLFARKIFDLKTVEEALAAVHVDWNLPSLKKEGHDIFRLKWKIKEDLGFSRSNLKVPGRFFETPTPWGRLQLEQFQQLRRSFEQYLH